MKSRRISKISSRGFANPFPENSFAKLSPHLHSHTPPHLKNIVAEGGAFPALLLLQKLCALHRGALACGERLVETFTYFC